tara:strand:- start:3181 stop:3369 length:189 start_codon:yes stop_codon:yes gene_type:complete
MSEEEFDNILKALSILANEEASTTLKEVIAELRQHQAFIMTSKEFEKNIDIDERSRKTYRMF